MYLKQGLPATAVIEYGKTVELHGWREKILQSLASRDYSNALLYCSHAIAEMLGEMRGGAAVRQEEYFRLRKFEGMIEQLR